MGVTNCTWFVLYFLLLCLSNCLHFKEVSEAGLTELYSIWEITFCARPVIKTHPETSGRTCGDVNFPPPRSYKSGPQNNHNQFVFNYTAKFKFCAHSPLEMLWIFKKASALSGFLGFSAKVLDFATFVLVSSLFLHLFRTQFPSFEGDEGCREQASFLNA